MPDMIDADSENRIQYYVTRHEDPMRRGERGPLSFTAQNRRRTDHAVYQL